MVKMINTILTAIAVCLVATMCAEKQTAGGNDSEGKKELHVKWDFDSADGWAYAHQDTATISQWSIENGSLYLRTRANTRDRSKMYTLEDDFIDGTYSWRIFIPNIAAYEQTSIAGFIYFDDEHELDFEIGYGTSKARAEYGAGPGDLVACMTNQAHPFSSSYFSISPGWHNFSIRLDVQDNRYVAYWLIDQVERKKVPLDFGPAEAQFHIMCSVENLEFIGERIPSHDNYGRFDYVSFDGNITASYHDPGKPVKKSFSVSGDILYSDGADANVFNKYGMGRFILNASTGQLSGVITETSDYYALFPYNANAMYSKSAISTIFESRQRATTDLNNCQKISVASSGGNTLDFRNVLSSISFTLGEELSGVSKISIEGNNGERLCGQLTINTGTLSAVCSGNGTKFSIEPEAGGSFETGTMYFTSVVPCHLSKGLSLIFTKDGRNIKYPINEPVSFEMGKTIGLGEIAGIEKWEETRWDFDKDITGWHYYTHTPNAVQEYYSVSNGIVKIWTLANTMDRNKIHTNSRIYGPGIYTWRTYVSNIAQGEKASIGAFIYADDTHELDFEIGYGKKNARASCNAKSDEMVACMTNQGLPYNSTYTPISVGWHTLTIKLDVNNGKYLASWYIDGIFKKSLQLQFGPETTFLISCSLENLEFMGDHQPKHDNYALFDYVSYKRLIR